jgi:predicted anti-sigma-YlaC factor YlaD
VPTNRRLTCAEFLDAYADYREGVLSDGTIVRAVERHLGECLKCRRLTETMTRGLALLQHTARDVEPSPAFRQRLSQRLRAEVAVGDPLMPTHAGLAAALLIATALGLLVYEGLTRRVDAAPLANHATAPTFEPALSDVTLPAFAHSTLEFHGSQAPLGSYTLFQR